MAEYLLDDRLGRSGEKIYLLDVEERANRLKKIYLDRMGAELDLDNPTLFTEKIQWYKLYYDNPNVTTCIDKVEGKKYVEKRIGKGHTAKILKVWNSPEEVSFDDLPQSFVVKSNCQDSGKYIQIIKDKEQHDLDGLKEEIKKYWYNPDNLLINGYCLGYNKVIPKVFVEEYIDNMSQALNDYKFFCFGGQPTFCYVAMEQFEEKTVGYASLLVSFYDLKWNNLHISYGKYPPYDDVPKPVHLDEMICAARKLSEGFPFVRVDFFDTPEKYYAGEMTFYPGGGLTPYNPISFNKYMGDLFVLPSDLNK